MTGSRRLSQAISEGDGISVIVYVADAEAGRAAEADGAEGLALLGPADGIRESTHLPLIWLGSFSEAHETDADAVVVDLDAVGDRLEEVVDEAHAVGLECVLRVRDEGDLEQALERIDPEIFLLSPREADEEEALEHVLDLLPDVPAGKLAIAELPATTREDVAALERAGVDAVLVATGNVAELVGGAPPAV